MWIWLVLLYGIIKGVREIVKKKALQRSATIEVLFLYTLLAFLIVLPDAKNAMGLEVKYYFFIGLKSFVVFLAWIFSFRAIKKMPISLYGVLDLSRVLFATLLGVIVLQEALGVFQVIGLALVSAGLLLLKYRPGKKVPAGQAAPQEADREKVDVKIVIMAFASCLFNAVSGLLDKLLMKDINSSQLQFWYLLFLALLYLLFILATGTKIQFFNVLKNYWVWLLSILIVIADRVLFWANGMDGSRVTVMTLLKQAGCVVTILAGRFLFHEKNTGHKLFCAAIIIAGIVLGVM
ncbi:MAG: EamA family transporter [Blautia sp.]|nr:EamA family transporter [Blautia sp.]MCM1201989.1 EamA family transporter [Bacteroides fragilis]